MSLSDVADLSMSLSNVAEPINGDAEQTETDFSVDSLCLNETTMKQVLVMAKIGRPIKFVIRLTPEERTWLEGMIHCGIGALNSALKARILLKT